MAGKGREGAGGCCRRNHLFLASMDGIDLGHCRCLGSIPVHYLACVRSSLGSIFIVAAIPCRRRFGLYAYDTSLLRRRTSRHLAGSTGLLRRSCLHCMLVKERHAWWPLGGNVKILTGLITDQEFAIGYAYPTKYAKLPSATRCLHSLTLSRLGYEPQKTLRFQVFRENVSRLCWRRCFDEAIARRWVFCEQNPVFCDQKSAWCNNTAIGYEPQVSEIEAHFRQRIAVSTSLYPGPTRVFSLLVVHTRVDRPPTFAHLI